MELPVTSINYLSTLALERAGIELPAYNQFLADLMETIPAINSKRLRSECAPAFCFPAKSERNPPKTPGTFVPGAFFSGIAEKPVKNP